MALYQIPVMSSPQILDVSVPIGDSNRALSIAVRYNTEADIWCIDISDRLTGGCLAANIPLVTGEYPAANILRQLGYLGLGVMIVVPVADHPDTDSPYADTLGTDFVLVMGTPDQEE